MRHLESKTVTIPAGATGLSPGFHLGGGDLVALRIGSAWVAADMTFQAASPALEAETPTPVYKDVYANGAELVITGIAADREVRLTDAQQEALRGLSRLKLRSGVTALPVNQTGSAEVELVYWVEI